MRKTTVAEQLQSLRSEPEDSLDDVYIAIAKHQLKQFQEIDRQIMQNVRKKQAERLMQDIENAHTTKEQK